MNANHAEPTAQRSSPSTQSLAASGSAPEHCTSFDSAAVRPAQDDGVRAQPLGVVQAHRLTLAGVTFLADPAGVLFHEAERTLLVADLHLEKGSSFARRGSLLPPYDTAATLAALGAVIARYAPRRVIALGDSFHDPYAASRLSAVDLAALQALQAGRDWLSDADRAHLAALQAGRAWLWLTGNHDPLPPEGLGGDVLPELWFGQILLRHQPSKEVGGGEIAGHLHPVARVVGSSGSARRRCFVTDGLRCIMPAFGAYAGGLNIHDAAYGSLFGPRAVMAHALGRDRVYPVPMERCIPDGGVDFVRYTAALRATLARA